MSPIPRSFCRIAAIGCLAITVLCILLQFKSENSQGIADKGLFAQHSQPYSTTPTSINHLSLNERFDLDEPTCRASFPLLFSEIDLSIARGPFTFHKSDPEYTGLVQARISNNHLYILTTSPSTLPTHLHQRTSTLSQIHRALLTFPHPLPNTTFSLVTNDVPKNNSFVYARPANPSSSYTVWLMPPFASWSWPTPGLGTLDTILDRIYSIENSTPWAEKVDKVVWRGTAWFNPLGYPSLRKDLLKVARGTEWADVEVLQGNNGNRMQIEQFCRYRYIVYTEGITYSGRLPFHQACESVVIMAPVTWVSWSAGLVKGVQAGELMREGDKLEGEGRWGGGGTSAYEDANAVFVKPDFSDLEDLVLFLRRRPDVARRIARNQRELVVGGGYLSMAAEVCYWRGLIRGWASMAKVEEEDWGSDEGERYETWLLKQVSP